MDATRASESNKPSKRGFIESLCKFTSSHITLFSLELNEAKSFVWVFFIHLAVIVVAASLFLIFSSLAILVYFWETYRLVAILGLLFFYLLVIVIGLISLANYKKNNKLFVACKEELAKDKEMFFEE